MLTPLAHALILLMLQPNLSAANLAYSQVFINLFSIVY